MALNAYTLSGARPEDGIAIAYTRARYPQVHLGKAGVPGFHNSIWLGVEGTRFPSINQDRLVAAEPCTVPGDSFQRLVRLNGWCGVLVRIIAKDLDFKVRAFSRDLSFHSGGVSLTIRPLSRFGDLGAWQLRDELFAIPEGQYVLVSDKRRGLVALECKGGELLMRQASREEVVAYVHGYGLVQKYGSPLQWALKNLIALDARVEALDIASRCRHLLTEPQRIYLSL